MNGDGSSRPIDLMHYLDKTGCFLKEVAKSIDNLLKLRRLSQLEALREKFQSKHSVKSFDFENGKNTDGPSLNKYDYEINFAAAQLVPLADRVGRLMSGSRLNRYFVKSVIPSA